MHRSACWTVETPLCLCLSFPTNMSTNPQFKCIQCHKFKLSGEFRMRQSAAIALPRKETACCVVCPVAPPPRQVESGGMSKATPTDQRSGLQHNPTHRLVNLWKLWPNLLLPPKSMVLGAFPWMG